MATEEELRKRVEELSRAQAENTRRIRELSRRNKASAVCEAWKTSHANVPGARHVIPPMFVQGNRVVNEPSADDLKKAQEYERWWNTTMVPIMRMEDDSWG